MGEIWKNLKIFWDSPVRGSSLLRAGSSECTLIERILPEIPSFFKIFCSFFISVPFNPCKLATFDYNCI